MTNKRIISGVQPSGDLTIGNYLGAMKRWPELQTKDREIFYFVANLHALNTRPDPKQLVENTLAIASWLLAIGIDPNRSNIFLESDVPQIPQLFTILNNFVTMGELSRMTQFKEKSGRHGEVVGLFEYPVLMAADIILFDIDLVPVGDDQRQHIEIARNVAQRFNNAYGDTFVVPEGLIQEHGARIMSLQDPKNKMSKSDTNPDAYILLSDSADVVKKKVMSAVTDSGNEIKVGRDKPAISNLLTIYSLATDKPVTEIERQFAGKSYAELKHSLADALVEMLSPMQDTFKKVSADGETKAALEKGARTAQNIAAKTLERVNKKTGIL